MAQVHCDVCHERFNRQSSLTRHKNNIHSERQHAFNCSTCFKNFTRQDLLLRHERLHRGEGLKPCPICSRSFRGDYLARHTKTCRLKARSPFSGSFISIKPHPPAPPSNGAAGVDGIPSRYQAMAPSLYPETPESSNKTKKCIKECYQQAPLRDPQQLVTEGELLDQAIIAMEDWKGDLSAFTNIVEAWRKRGFSIRRFLSIEANGLNLLARASYSSPEVTEYLLTLDIDVNQKDSFRRTTLHWLCRNGLADLVERILTRVESLDPLDKIDDTPLCLASRYGHTRVVKLLCEHGADVNAKGLTPKYFANPAGSNQTPLELAIRSHQRDGIIALLGANANPNLRGELMPLEMAIWDGSSEDVERLLEAGADIDLLGVAYVNMLRDAVNPTCEASTVLKDASQKFKALLHSGKKSRSRCRTVFRPLAFTAEESIRKAISSDDTAHLDPNHGEFATVGALRHFFESAFPDHLSPIMLAARDGAVNCVRYMLHWWPDLSRKYNHGLTALHYACISDNDQIVQLLLDGGAPVDSCSASVETPLCIAAMKGNRKVMAILLEAGAGIDGKGLLFPGSPLSWACMENQQWAASFLISEGADVNYSATTNTPLENALQRGSASLVSTLLSAGARADCISEDIWKKVGSASWYGLGGGAREVTEKMQLLTQTLDKPREDEVDIEMT
jgi:ankyrin repeat protein